MSALAALESLLLAAIAARAQFPRQPFARLDRLIYSTLCLGIALTCAGLLLMRLGKPR